MKSPRDRAELQHRSKSLDLLSWQNRMKNPGPLLAVVAWRSITPEQEMKRRSAPQIRRTFLSGKAFCYKGGESGVIDFREKNDSNFSHGSWFSTCRNLCAFV